MPLALRIPQGNRLRNEQTRRHQSQNLQSRRPGVVDPRHSRGASAVETAQHIAEGIVRGRAVAKVAERFRIFLYDDRQTWPFPRRCPCCRSRSARLSEGYPGIESGSRFLCGSLRFPPAVPEMSGSFSCLLSGFLVSLLFYRREAFLRWTCSSELPFFPHGSPGNFLERLFASDCRDLARGVLEMRGGDLLQLARCEEVSQTTNQDSEEFLK